VFRQITDYYSATDDGKTDEDAFGIFLN